MSIVWDTETTSHTEKLVLLALADNANDAGVCWPSVSKLAKKTQLSEWGLRKQIKAIMAKEWLTSKARFNRSGDRTSNLYQLNLGVGNPVEGVGNHIQGGGQPGRPRVGNPVEGNHHIEPSKNHQRGKAPDLFVSELEKVKAAKERILEDLRYEKEKLPERDKLRAEIKELDRRIAAMA